MPGHRERQKGECEKGKHEVICGYYGPDFFLFCFSVLKSKKNLMGIVKVNGIEMSEKRIETNQKGISTQIKN